MPLTKKPLELGATKFFVEAGHQRTAIEATVAHIDAGVRSFPEHADDSLESEFSSIERQWVIETLYQGAYVRSYHSWEKGCKEYFLPKGVDMTPPRGVSFTNHVSQVLSSHLSLDLPEDVLVALCTMRCNVNRMKHGPKGGLPDDEFIVSAEDYAVAIAAIERFWEFLSDNERVTG